MPPLKLNLGSGSNKIPGYTNIDSEKLCKPDLVFDFTKKRLPYPTSSVSEILLFHCLEHIEKSRHYGLFKDFSRVLKQGGKLYVSYPNFAECAKRWIDNTSGKRSFWEATIYGRQLYPGDYHVCIVDPDELALLLADCGFDKVESRPEPDEAYNTITTAIKARQPSMSYEVLVASDIKNMRVVGVGVK